MKTKFLFLALLIVLSTTGFSRHVEPGMTIISTEGSEIFKVIYKGATTGKAKVRMNIYNAAGSVILSETFLSVGGFICPVNFKGLPPGNYSIEILTNEGEYKEKIAYKIKKRWDKKTIHVSKIPSEEKYLLSVANLRGEYIHISIYEKHQGLLYKESKMIDADFAQVYKLPKANGQYTFEVVDAMGHKKYFSF